MCDPVPNDIILPNVNTLPVTEEEEECFKNMSKTTNALFDKLTKPSRVPVITRSTIEAYARVSLDIVTDRERLEYLAEMPINNNDYLKFIATMHGSPHHKPDYDTLVAYIDPIIIATRHLKPI